MFERGKIVLLPFPFTDLSSSKVRPALIVSDAKYAEGDVSVVFISSKIPKRVKATDFVLGPSARHFELTGLKVASVIKCNKLATLDRRIVLGELGFLSPADLKEVDEALRLALGL